MLEIYALVICNLQRLLRNRELAALCVLLAVLTGGLESYGRINSSISALVLLAASIAICLFRTLIDKRQGFEAGIISTGVPYLLINAGRVLFTTVLFLTFYVLHGIIFYIM
jgi:4-amino-4-deoxy-L-arabinose transferase-like glycosyltransferase